MQPRLKGYSRLEYFAKATAFLTECRAESPVGGMWDVADLQWWWRDNEYADPKHQLFLEDARGQVLGFVLLSPSYMTFDYEILPGHESSIPVAKMFGYALEWLNDRANFHPGGVSVLIRAEHTNLRQLAEARGFLANGHSHVQTVMELAPSSPADADARVRPLRASDLRHGKPPIIGTSAEKFARVRQTPMYRPEQHLVLVDEQSHPIAECIYWTDGSNRIGLFEPVETHPIHRRKGFGKALIWEGLRQLSAHGVRLAKVSYYSTNKAAAELYRSVGFKPRFERLLYERASHYVASE